MAWRRMEGYSDFLLIPQLLLNPTERDYRQKQDQISWDLHKVLRQKQGCDWSLDTKVGRKDRVSFLE